MLEDPGGPDFPYVVTNPGIHHELLKVVRLATLADPNSARVICFLWLVLWRIARAFECFATSVRFESVLATRFIIRIAFGIVRFTFGNFVVFHILVLFESRLLSGFLYRAQATNRGALVFQSFAKSGHASGARLQRFSRL